MRVRVQSSWRTRLLLLLAFVAAGIIAYNRVQSQLEAEREVASTPSADASTSDDREVIEVEIVGQE